MADSGGRGPVGPDPGDPAQFLALRRHHAHHESDRDAGRCLPHELDRIDQPRHGHPWHHDPPGGPEGRGGAKETLVVHKEGQWQVHGYTYLYNCQYGGGGVVCTTGIGYITYYRPWDPVGPGYAQGVLVDRSGGDWG